MSTQLAPHGAAGFVPRTPSPTRARGARSLRGLPLPLHLAALVFCCLTCQATHPHLYKMDSVYAAFSEELRRAQQGEVLPLDEQDGLVVRWSAICEQRLVITSLHECSMLCYTATTLATVLKHQLTRARSLAAQAASSRAGPHTGRGRVMDIGAQYMAASAGSLRVSNALHTNAAAQLTLVAV